MLTLNADSFSLEDIVNIGATFQTMKSTLYRHRATARSKLPKCRGNICLDSPRTTTLETKKTLLVYQAAPNRLLIFVSEVYT